MKDANHKVLIAGVGNVLHGDDGFGVELAQQLMKSAILPSSVKVIETGIGGMSLIQELMYGYDVLLILDAYKNDGTPGHLYLLEPVFPDMSNLTIHELRDYFSDTHYATPMRALNFLTYINQLPKVIRIIGCEPEELDSFRIGLSNPVANSLDKAMQLVLDCLSGQIDTMTAPQHEKISVSDA